MGGFDHNVWDESAEFDFSSLDPHLFSETQ